MSDIDLGPLENGPHARLIRGLAERWFEDAAVQAVWVGGSLASEEGDAYSDVDFRVAVTPDRLETYVRPDWDRYLPLPSVGGTFLRFGDHAFLHHRVLSDGTLLDVFVQDTSERLPEPSLVVVACRDERFGEALADFPGPPAPLVREIRPDAARQLLVDYWITTHKEMKGLGRRLDTSLFAGLYFERIALLRAWYMELAGKDIDARPSIHVLTALHRGLDGRLTPEQHDLLGLPSRTPEETVLAIEAIREEMARVGRSLSESHGFRYPRELEEVVLGSWTTNKRELLKR